MPLRLGFRAIGSDVNAMFVAGAERNLNYAGLIPQIEIEERVSAFSNRDSAGIFAPAPPVDDAAAATDGSIAPSSLSSSAHSHSDAMLQLYTKVSGRHLSRNTIYTSHCQLGIPTL